jgi:SAM-dependent methyltransferase
MTSLSHDSPELAAAYDRLSDTQFESGQRLVERLGVKSGDRVLDVGCGTGRLTRWIADKVAPDGAAIGIDPLIDRVAIARARSPGVSFEVGRAEDLSAFPDASFDVVCLSAVFHWVPDKPRALSEIRRVLRPGGRMGLTTMPRELHLAGTVARVCGPVFRRAPYKDRVDGAKVAARMNMPSLTELVGLILASGLDFVEAHAGERTRRHASGLDAVDFVESSSFGNLLSLVPEDLRSSLRADLAAAFDAAHREGEQAAAEIVLREYGAALVARRGA